MNNQVMKKDPQAFLPNINASNMYDRFFDQQNTQRFQRRETQDVKGQGAVEPRRFLMGHLYLVRFFDAPVASPQFDTREPSQEHSQELQASTDQSRDQNDAPLPVAPELVAFETGIPSESQSSSFFARLKTGLQKTRTQFTKGLSQLFSRDQALGREFFDELETQLIMADVGVTTTASIVEQLKSFATEQDLFKHENGHAVLKEKLKALLVETLACETSEFASDKGARKAGSPEMILVVGVNGVGKTTTIGKLAQQSKKAGKSVMLAAGDTFRAAAVEQLQVWGERTDVQVVSQGQGSDSASVIYDALQSAQAKKIDVLIADTAGRLHNKSNLMNELRKIVRVVKKLDESAPHKVLLVVDGCTGQNALSQGREFNAAVGLTGLVVTKLDGTAKGGILFALSQSLGVPVEYIGIGEGVDDLRQFDGDAYVEALLDFDDEGAST